MKIRHTLVRKKSNLIKKQNGFTKLRGVSCIRPKESSFKIRTHGKCRYNQTNSQLKWTGEYSCYLSWPVWLQMAKWWWFISVGLPWLHAFDSLGFLTYLVSPLIWFVNQRKIGLGFGMAVKVCVWYRLECIRLFQLFKLNLLNHHFATLTNWSMLFFW